MPIKQPYDFYNHSPLAKKLISAVYHATSKQHQVEITQEKIEENVKNTKEINDKLDVFTKFYNDWQNKILTLCSMFLALNPDKEEKREEYEKMAEPQLLKLLRQYFSTILPNPVFVCTDKDNTNVDWRATIAANRQCVVTSSIEEWDESIKEIMTIQKKGNLDWMVKLPTYKPRDKIPGRASRPLENKIEFHISDQCADLEGTVLKVSTEGLKIKPRTKITFNAGISFFGIENNRVLIGVPRLEENLIIDYLVRDGFISGNFWCSFYSKDGSMPKEIIYDLYTVVVARGTSFAVNGTPRAIKGSAAINPANSIYNVIISLFVFTGDCYSRPYTQGGTFPQIVWASQDGKTTLEATKTPSVCIPRQRASKMGIIMIPSGMVSINEVHKAKAAAVVPYNKVGRFISPIEVISETTFVKKEKQEVKPHPFGGINGFHDSEAYHIVTKITRKLIKYTNYERLIEAFLKRSVDPKTDKDLLRQVAIRSDKITNLDVLRKIETTINIPGYIDSPAYKITMAQPTFTDICDAQLNMCLKTCTDLISNEAKRTFEGVDDEIPHKRVKLE